MVVGVYFWSAYVAWSRREFSKALELKGNRLQHARHDGTLELAPLLVLASYGQRPFQKKRAKKGDPCGALGGVKPAVRGKDGGRAQCRLERAGHQFT
jgi:hypothetical protein